MSAYFKQLRLDWIDETLHIFGFINREHLVRKFGVSVPQASLDMQEARCRNALITYNPSLKRYEIHGVDPVGESPR